jgi:hypothetical protein
LDNNVAVKGLLQGAEGRFFGLAATGEAAPLRGERDNLRVWVEQLAATLAPGQKLALSFAALMVEVSGGGMGEGCQ